MPRELIYPPDRPSSRSSSRTPRTSSSRRPAPRPPRCASWATRCRCVVKRSPPDGAGGRRAEGRRRDHLGRRREGAPGRDQLTELVRAKPAGTALTIGYTRDGAGRHRDHHDQPGAGRHGPRIGVEHRAAAAAPVHPQDRPGRHRRPDRRPDVRPRHHRQARSRTDLTGGKIIAGTGTIDDEGNVGPIGGIPQKLVGGQERRRQGVPRPGGQLRRGGRATPQPGLPLLKVATLDDALTALETLRAGGQPTRC